jgi:uncharacterized membrane protein YfcA
MFIMSVTTILILIAIGMAAGVLGGMIGLGGGIIMIPAMVFFLGMSQKMAQGTSMAVMLPPIGLLAVINYYRAGYINIKFGLIIAVAFMIGGFLGSKLALSLPEALIRKLFAVLLVGIAVKMFFAKG